MHLPRRFWCLFLFLMTIIFLSFAWWYREREKIEFTASAVGVFIGVASYFSQDSLVEIFSEPRFYVAFALVCCVPLVAGWYFTILKSDARPQPKPHPADEQRKLPIPDDVEDASG